MREMNKRRYFLLEGSIQSAGQFQAYGANDEDMVPTSFMVRFIGRSVLLSDTRFIQTRDEQGSLRAVASSALMSCASGRGTSTIENPYSPAKLDMKQERFLVIQRLSIKGGIPLAIAKRVPRLLALVGNSIVFTTALRTM
jgi:hypothetical protein